MSNVLKVSLQEAIRSLHEKGWGQRRIARELGIHRNTVKGYIEGGSKCTTQSTAGQGPDGGRRNHFFGAALGFSCFGFLFFLSFFWLLLPLPIDRLPSW